MVFQQHLNEIPQQNFSNLAHAFANTLSFAATL